MEHKTIETIQENTGQVLAVSPTSPQILSDGGFNLIVLDIS